MLHLAASPMARTSLARRPHAPLPSSAAPRCLRALAASASGGGGKAEEAPSVSATGAFIGGVKIPGSGAGPLTGTSFGAKDLYDIEGFRTGAGNPSWRATHPPADGTAPAVAALLAAGASMAGKCVMDELAYSINGENFHYGTPVNPACPDRIPGGSSSGSAVAVAGGEVDFALGSDTAGSVRVPAAFCGVLGFRPSHGRVSLERAVPLAKSFDTGGVFAPRDRPDLLRSVMEVLLETGPTPVDPSPAPLTRWSAGVDAFGLAEGPTVAAIYEAVSSRASALPERMGAMGEVEIAAVEGEGGLREWFAKFRALQAADVWAAHGAWVTAEEPAFGPGVRDRFRLASEVTPADVASAAESQAKIRAHMDGMLEGGGVLVVPAAPSPPPKLRTPPGELEEFRQCTLALTCPAGLAGLPQVTLPVATVDGCPVAIGLISARGTDEALLRLAEELMPIFNAPAPSA